MNAIIKDIESSYNSINENRQLLKELEMVRLGDLNYSNVSPDNDQTKNDEVNKALIDDIQRAAKSIGIDVTITTAKSGHSEKTITGRQSRHSEGTGVDVAILNGVGSKDPKFKQLGDKLKDALVSMGYVWNTESGNPKSVLWQTNLGGNHYNHLHISNNSGESTEEPLLTKSSDVDKEKEDIDSTVTKDYNGEGDPIIKAFAQSIAKNLGLKENVERIKTLLK